MRKNMGLQIAAAAMALTLASPFAALAAGTTYTPVNGSADTFKFDKYLVMKNDANVPNYTAMFKIEAGSAIAADATKGKMEVLAGPVANGAPSITGTAVFAPTDTPTAENAVPEGKTVKAALQEEHDTWLIPNPEIYQLNLVKVASEDHATVLTGAKFRFYRDTNGNGKLDLAEGASDAMMGFHVKSAGNYIYDDGGRISSAVTSELAMTDNGTLDLSGLPAGTYFLKETTAPEGRHIWGSDNEYWTFTIRYDASVASVYPDGTGSITGGVMTGASSVIPLVKASEDEAYTANLTETQKAELVSNGTWLVPNLSRKLVDTGLDEKAKQYWMLVLAAMAGFALLLMAEDRKRKSRGR